jgi:hypothetical protein
VRKVVQKRIRRTGDGVNIVADVNAAVAATVGKSDGVAATTRRQSVTIVQRNGRTEITEEHSEG